MILLGTLMLLVVLTNLGGTVVRAAGMPRVIGVMFAGVGLGMLLPVLGRDLPVGALLEEGGLLGGIATLGIALFMVDVGYHLRVPVERLPGETPPGRSRAVAAVSLVTGVPFAVGAATAWVTYDAWAGDDVPFGAYAVMHGCLFTLTAVPVLQRILVEYGLAPTVLGRFALTQSLATDVLVWGLVTVVAGVHGSTDPLTAVLTLGASLAAVFLVCRTWEWCCARADAGVPAQAWSLVLLVVLVAQLGSVLGQSTLVMGLVVGVCLRHDRAGGTVVAAIARVNVRSLFPLFFVQIGLTLDTWSGGGLGLPVAVVAAVMVAAYAVKWLASFVGARVSGLGSESASAATLLSVRGATELALAVALYESGLVGGAGLTSLIAFAIISTFVAVLCSLPLRGRAAPAADRPAEAVPVGAAP